MFNLSPASPSQIIIQPVANGWVVSIPSDNSEAMENQFNQVAPMLKNIVSELQGDSETDKIIREAERDLQRAERSAQPLMVRDKSMLIFDTFEKVLAYLAKHVQD